MDGFDFARVVRELVPTARHCGRAHNLGGLIERAFAQERVTQDCKEGRERVRPFLVNLVEGRAKRLQQITAFAPVEDDRERADGDVRQTGQNIVVRTIGVDPRPRHLPDLQLIPA